MYQNDIAEYTILMILWLAIKYGELGGQFNTSKGGYCEIIGNIHENPNS